MKVLNFLPPLPAFIFVSLFSLSVQKEILSADNDVCRLFKDGTILRKPGTCNESIKCVNHKSEHLNTCTGTKALYNKNTFACAATNADAYCKAPCAKTSPTYVVDSKNCNNWYKCNAAKVAGQGSCNAGLVFDQKSQLCVYPSQSTCQATYEICDIASTAVGNTYMDVNNCHKYFTCGAKGEVDNTCAAGTYYDVDLGECIPKAQVNCYKHPVPDNACGTVKLAIRNRFVSDGATCRGYFYCKDNGVNSPDKAPEWRQCPNNYFFSETDQACVAKHNVKCNEDRCDGLVDAQTLSGTYGCRNYLICENNYTVEEVQCPVGEYYDIEKKACTTQVKSYSACT